jgi:hypothetical protein
MAPARCRATSSSLDEVDFVKAEPAPADCHAPVPQATSRTVELLQIDGVAQHVGRGTVSQAIRPQSPLLHVCCWGDDRVEGGRAHVNLSNCNGTPTDQGWQIRASGP